MTHSCPTQPFIVHEYWRRAKNSSLLNRSLPLLARPHWDIRLHRLDACKGLSVGHCSHWATRRCDDHVPVRVCAPHLLALLFARNVPYVHRMSVPCRPCRRHRQHPGAFLLRGCMASLLSADTTQRGRVTPAQWNETSGYGMTRCITLSLSLPIQWGTEGESYALVMRPRDQGVARDGALQCPFTGHE